MVSDEELMTRAKRAYFVASARAGEGSALIPANWSGIEELNGKLYAVLRNVDRILAVYRVRNDGKLKRLRRWPDELEGLTPGGQKAQSKKAAAPRRAKKGK